VKLSTVGSGNKNKYKCVNLHGVPCTSFSLPGPPVREPGMSEEERKHLMLMEHRRREEVKRLLEDNDDNYLDQDWADGRQLAQSLQGVKDISWKPRF